eukprot:CAMPEP_0172747926 /NCGR_PEP_ID=MMETSP1074-20121228/143917_1 /TAXON_ID=2916 /ORGANISM="Ceratium fusus, Strain PA161109" /LENGTH=414 /DNA_ID=CAMNT_0013579567 /DNA_START=72 /DNA_END=1313 /DNA_ORIENTATION=-
MMASSALWLLKVVAAICCLGVAVMGCALARRLQQPQGQGQARMAMLTFGNTLAAGVLLSASLTHMLPDATEALEDVTPFPLASAIAGSAFVFLVVLGEVVGGCMPARDEPHTSTACVAYEASFALWPRWELVPPHGCEDVAASPRTKPDVEPSMTDSEAVSRNVSDGQCGHCLSDSPVLGAKPSPLLEPLIPQSQHSCHSHSSCCRVHRHSDATCRTELLGQAGQNAQDRQPLASLATGAECAQVNQAATHDVPLCHVRGVGGGPITEVKSFMLFFALSFHSAMEGLGLGSSSDAGLLLPILVAILAHKGLAAFALGCSLAQSNLPDWKFWVFVAIFAMGTPIGCAVGMISTDVGSAVTQGWVSGCCIAVASGTFLQVSSMELLPRALAEEGHKVLGITGLVFGFALMSTLAIW